MDLLDDDCLLSIIKCCRNLHTLCTLRCVSHRLELLTTRVCHSELWSVEKSGTYSPAGFMSEDLVLAANTLRLHGTCFVATSDDCILVVNALLYAYHRGVPVAKTTYGFVNAMLSVLESDPADADNVRIGIILGDFTSDFMSLCRNSLVDTYLIAINPKFPMAISPTASERKFKFYFEHEFYGNKEGALRITATQFDIYYKTIKPHKVLLVDHASVRFVCNLLLRYATRVHKVVLLAKYPERSDKSSDYASFPLPHVPEFYIDVTDQIVDINTLRIVRGVTYRDFFRRSLTPGEKDVNFLKSPYLVSSLHKPDDPVQGTYRFRNESRDLSHTLAHLQTYVEANLSGKYPTCDYNLKVVDLRIICRMNGLPAEGKRSDLLRRLADFTKN